MDPAPPLTRLVPRLARLVSGGDHLSMEAPVLPANLPALLRSEGLRVVEHDGWRHRGRPGSFAPVGVLCHHTATGRAWTDKATVDLLIKGHSTLPGPLCQLGLARDGTVHLIAAGRANHAGVAKSSGTVAAGDGNTLYVGVEAFNDGVGEPWPDVQYDAYVRLAAALCKHVTGNSAQTVRAHKETSVTGKVDPRFDMNTFRARVHTALTDPTAASRPTLEDDMPYTDWPKKDRDALVADITKALRITVPGVERDVDLATALHYAWLHAKAANAQTKTGVDIDALAAAVAAKVGGAASAKAVAAELLRQLTTEES